jgi:hypothetical protein
MNKAGKQNKGSGDLEPGLEADADEQHVFPRVPERRLQSTLVRVLSVSEHRY